LSAPWTLAHECGNLGCSVDWKRARLCPCDVVSIAPKLRGGVGSQIAQCFSFWLPPQTHFTGRDRVHKGLLWMFGGYGYDFDGKIGLLNDLWSFDPNDGLWTFHNGEKRGNGTGFVGDVSTSWKSFTTPCFTSRSTYTCEPHHVSLAPCACTARTVSFSARHALPVF
jgi:hypothetical protein